MPEPDRVPGDGVILTDPTRVLVNLEDPTGEYCGVCAVQPTYRVDEVTSAATTPTGAGVEVFEVDTGASI